MPLVETRTISLAKAGLEIKSTDGEPTLVSGWASTFGGEPDAYQDVIAPGAYTETIREWGTSDHPLPMLLGHDPDKPIGVWHTLIEDSKGLRVEGSLTPGNDLSRNVEASLRHRAISGLSIGFRTKQASQGPNGTRVLEKIDLFEISAVVQPANRFARVTGVKSIAGDVETIRDFEALLRSHGWSRREAEAIASRGFKAFLAARDEQDGNDGAAADAKAAAELARVAAEEARTAEAAAKAAVLAAEQRRDGEKRAAELIALLRGLTLTPTP